MWQYGSVGQWSPAFWDSQGERGNHVNLSIARVPRWMGRKEIAVLTVDTLVSAVCNVPTCKRMDISRVPAVPLTEK